MTMPTLVTGHPGRSGRQTFRQVATAAITLMLLVGCSSNDRAAAPTTTRPKAAAGTGQRTAVPTDPALLAKDTFLVGVPLLTTVRTMQTFAQLVGTNKLFWVPRLANATSRFVVAPNRDTLYVLAIVDLRVGPQVLTVPEIKDRYYVFQFIDAWMNSFAYVGTRATSGRAGSWVLVPPGYRGEIPSGMNRLDASTNQVIILGRLRATDDADAATALRLQPRTTLQLLFARTAASTAAPVAPMSKPAGTPQSVGENGIRYFDELGDALAVNPPVTEQQRAVIGAAAKLGVGPGRHPGAAPTGKGTGVLERAAGDGLKDLRDRSIVGGGTTINGWNINLGIGGAHPTLGLREQAGIAKYYWGPNIAEEAVYPRAVAASDGDPLDGSKRYVIHLSKNDLPPVDAFWSYTVYGPDMFFVPNAGNRYNISGQTPGLVTNADGSLDIYLQHDPPTGHEGNWLPTPTGPFNLIMRLYLPRRPILDGTYRYPPVTVVG